MQRMRSGSNIKANRNNCKGDHCDHSNTNLYRVVKNCSRFIIVILVFVICCSVFCVKTLAEESDPYTELYSILNVDELEDVSDENISKYFDVDLSDSKSIWNINGYDLLISLAKNSFLTDGTSLNVLKIILIFSIVFIVTKNTLIESENLNYSFDVVSAGVCAVILLLPVSTLIFDVCKVVKSCCIFMNAFIPIYAALIVAVGYSATSASYSTLMFSVTQIFSIIADIIIVPLSNLTLVSSIGAAFNTVSKGFYELLRKSIIIILSTSMGIFIAVLNLQTVISAPSDTIGIKTVKTALGTFIPIVGTALSDSVSVLLAGAGTLKSTVGVYAVINIVVCVVPVLIKLLIWRLTVAVSVIMLELSQSEMSVNIVKAIGSVITLMISVVLCVSVAYLLSVILTLSIGG